MKKTLTSLAVVAGMAASGAALAGDATIYGNVHLSIDDVDTGSTADEITMNSNTSSFGVKGSEDLGGGMKALFKIEWQIDPSERATNIIDRDQWVGLKGGMGTVKFGTMSSNWKQKGGKVDPMYRTRLEGRGFLGIQSNLHSGAGRTRGRMTDILQYSSPKMGGMQMIINTTFDGAQTAGNQSIDETMGIGFRYSGKGFMAYLDWVDMAEDVAGVVVSNSATKVGGKFKAGPVTIGAQFESAEDITGSDYTYLSVKYGVGKNGSVAVNIGAQAAKATNSDSSAFAILYNHKLGKKTNVYVGFGDRSDDVGAGESMTTFGLRKKF